MSIHMDNGFATCEACGGQSFILQNMYDGNIRVSCANTVPSDTRPGSQRICGRFYMLMLTWRNDKDPFAGRRGA